MTLLELVAKVTLDSGKYEHGLKVLKHDTEETANKIKKGFLTATKIGAAALGAFAVTSVKTGMEFDKAMSQVAATMGKTTDEIGELRDFAKQMGETTQFSARQAAEALNYMALAGYDAEKSMAMLPNVLNLAAAGNMDLASASDMVTDAQSALGLTTEETVEMVDKMAKAASNSNTSVAQLGEGFLTVGALARDLKGGTTELSVALGILADNGLKGSAGGTALRNVLQSIKSAKFEKTFGKLGVSAYDAEGNLRSLEDIVNDMNKALEGMSTKEKNEIISKTFNKYDITAVNDLLGTTSERWAELTEEINNSEGAAAKMAETQLDNLSGDITKMKSAFEGVQIALYEKLEPAIRTVVQALTKFFGNMETWGPIILGLATAFGVLAVAINITSIIKKVTVAFTALGTVLAANPIGIVVAAIAGLVVALTLLWQNNEEFREKVIEIWEAIKEFFAGVGEWFGGLIDGIKEWFNGLKESIAETWDNIKNKIAEVWQAILDNPIVQAIVNYVATTFENMKNTLTGIFDGIKNIASGAWELIKNVILAPILLLIDLVTGNFDKLKEDAANIWENIKEAAGKIWDGIKEVITSIASGIVEQVKNILSTIKKIASTIWTAVKDKAVEIWTNIKNKVVDTAKNLISGVKEKITELPKIIKKKFTEAMDFIKNLPKKALTWGKDLIANFINGIKEKFKKLKDTLSDVASGIRDFLGFSEPEKGPLSNFHTYAPDMMNLFMQGIRDNEKKLQNTVAKAFDFENLIAEPTVNTARSGGVNNITINVQGAKGQDVNELADIISRKLNNELRRTQEVWA